MHFFSFFGKITSYIIEGTLYIGIKMIGISVLTSFMDAP